MIKINTESAPLAAGPYSQAISTGGTIYVSGMLGIEPRGMMPEGVAAQTECAIRNLAAVLEAAGSDLAHVVKTTCYLAHIGDFATFNDVYGGFFTGKPARSCIEAAALPKGSLIEIDAIAITKEQEEKR